MCEKTLLRTAVLNRLDDVVHDFECVHLYELPPFTALHVRTVNSLYRVVTSPGADVLVQGGAFFQEETPAYLDGASIGGSRLRVGCICVGMLLEIRSGGRRVITSRVLAITAVQASGVGCPSDGCAAR